MVVGTGAADHGTRYIRNSAPRTIIAAEIV
jgi:hypothetical protein